LHSLFICSRASAFGWAMISPRDLQTEPYIRRGGGGGMGQPYYRLSSGQMLSVVKFVFGAFGACFCYLHFLMYVTLSYFLINAGVQSVAYQNFFWGWGISCGGWTKVGHFALKIFCRKTSISVSSFDTPDFGRLQPLLAFLPMLLVELRAKLDLKQLSTAVVKCWSILGKLTLYLVIWRPLWYISLG